MKTAPKHRFRAHRRGRDLHIGREPLPAVAAWLEANRSRLRPGQVTAVQVLHESHCTYPKGGPCACPDGPEIRIKGERPEEN